VFLRRGSQRESTSGDARKAQPKHLLVERVEEHVLHNVEQAGT
jgi:hypothetical protein